jgi:hypothetical protein
MLLRGDSTEMSKFNHILAALLLCVAGLAAYGQDSPFKAEIKLAQTTVNNYETFSVATAIRNTSTEEQTLDIWSCSYPTQWVSDVSSVHVNLVGCKKNDLLHIKLKPGEACERAVTIRIQLSPGDGKPESVTFLMGFKSATFVTGQSNLPLWSNAVTVSVTK